MAFAYFISQDYLKENTPIDVNVDQKILNKVMRDCQEIYIKPVLGTDLYDKFVTDINASSVSGVYQTLLDDHIIPALIDWILYAAPLPISFKYRNNGLMQQSNEGGAGVSIQDMNKIEDYYLRQAKIRTDYLVDWLCANEEDYPEYSSNTDDGDRSPIGAGIGMGIYLGVDKKGVDCE